MQPINVFYYKCTYCRCNSAYHIGYIKQWFTQKQECPLCRKSQENIGSLTCLESKVYRFYEAAVTICGFLVMFIMFAMLL